MYSPSDLIPAAQAVQGLVLGDIDELEYLAAIKTLTRADGVIMPRWLSNNHAQIKTSELGAPTALPVGFKHHIDHIALSAADSPSLVHTTETHKECHPEAAAFIDSPHVMCVLLDCHPACILLVLTRHPDNAQWSQAEQLSFMDFATLIRKSVRLHKLMDDAASIIKTAQSVFNAQPGGMLTVLPDGNVPIANRVAVNIIKKDGALALENGRLTIKDKNIHTDFLNNLAAIEAMSTENIDDYSRHYLIDRIDGKGIFQMSMNVVRLPGWNLESRPSDMVILVYLIDPSDLEEPSTKMLKQVYGLTEAQAKVAVALWGGTSIHDAADSLSISVNTARTHLRSIYEKTGVSNHAELMANMTGTLSRLGSLDKAGQYYRSGSFIDC